MSTSRSLEYILQQQRRKELQLKRIEENVRLYLAKYENAFSEFRKEGLSDYIPSEMQILKQDIETIKSNLGQSKIEYALQVSNNIGSYIYNYRSISKEVKKELEEISKIKTERLLLEQKEQKNKLSQMVTQKLIEITDPVIRDFAYDLSMSIKQRITDSAIKDETDLNSEIEKVLFNAENKAKEWKQKHKKKNEVSDKKEMIKAQIEMLRETNKTEKSEEVESVIQDLENVEKTANQDNIKNIELVVKEKLNNAEDKILDERIRREVVRSLFKSLKKQGFIVSDPQIDNEKDIVIIKANKPSGHRAQCKIELDGKFSYKFDGYEGMSCLKDMEKVNAELQEIYGIKIKTENINWENPNRISKDANSMPSSNNNEFGG
jgi:hypothetical protein